MPRAFHIPGVVFLLCALVLLFLVSISLPYLTALDIVRVHFEGGPSTDTQGSLTELRVSGHGTHLETLTNERVELDWHA